MLHRRNYRFAVVNTTQQCYLSTSTVDELYVAISTVALQQQSCSYSLSRVSNEKYRLVLHPIASTYVHIISSLHEYTCNRMFHIDGYM